MHPLRQDVEQEASDEFFGRDGHGAVAGLLLPRLGRLAVAEGIRLPTVGWQWGLYTKSQKDEHDGEQYHRHRKPHE